VTLVRIRSQTIQDLPFCKHF